MVLQLDMHVGESEPQPLLDSIHKNYFEMGHRCKLKIETYEAFKENIEYLCYLGLGKDFLDRI